VCVRIRMYTIASSTPAIAPEREREREKEKDPYDTYV